MSNDLIRFWSRFDPEGEKPYLHPDDRAWFERNHPEVLDQKTETFESFLTGDRFGMKDDSKLHLSLLPAPFHGDISKASIFILLMNPGFSDSDYYADEHPAFRQASIANLKQENVNNEFPYFSLNPLFAWSGAYRWIEARMRPVLQQMKHEGDGSYYKALSDLSRQIAVVELFPYHSSNGKAIPSAAWQSLPSVLAARNFVHNDLCRSSSRPEILMMRSHGKWDISDKTIRKCKPGRTITFNPKLDKPAGDAGKAILAKLKLSSH